MIDLRLRNYIKTATAQSLMPVRPPLLQRKCACGAAHGLSACGECSRKGNSASQLAPAHSSLVESLSPGLEGKTVHATDGVQRSTVPGHHFSHLSIYPEHYEARDGAINVNGPASNRLSGDAIFIDGPDKDAPKPEAPKTPPSQKTPPPKEKPPAAKADCPTDIQVNRIDQIPDPDFGKPDGFKTGVGAVARMEVSGPGRKDWKGVKIHESLKQTTNTCGARARKVCSNISGENVDFEVGKEGNILGKGKLSAVTNAFHDIHIFAMKDVSVLHEKGLADCQVQCEQTFKCGGKQIGPQFIITYNATKDTVRSADVTRIRVEKSPKAAPAAPPPKP